MHSINKKQTKNILTFNILCSTMVFLKVYASRNHRWYVYNIWLSHFVNLQDFVDFRSSALCSSVTQNSHRKYFIFNNLLKLGSCIQMRHGFLGKDTMESCTQVFCSFVSLHEHAWTRAISFFLFLLFAFRHRMNRNHWTFAGNFQVFRNSQVHDRNDMMR